MIIKKYYKLIRVSHEDSAYMRLKNVSNEVGIFKMVKTGSPTAPNLEYSLDGVTWTTYDFTTLPEVAVAAGANIYFRGTNANGFNPMGSYGSDPGSFTFYMSVQHTAAGNVQSINYSDLTSVSSFKSIRKIFKDDINLISVKDLIIGSVGATTITDTKAKAVFSGCTALTDGPDMSAITQIVGSTNGSWNIPIEEMFSGCSSMVTPPDTSGLTVFGDRAGAKAFYGCTALTTPPDFSNVTTLGDRACINLFSGCTSLKTGLDLRNVATVSASAMEYLYDGCTHLETAYCPNVNSWDTSVANAWLQQAGTQATGTKTVYAPTGVTIPTGSTSGIPTGWTRVDY